MAGQNLARRVGELEKASTSGPAVYVWRCEDENCEDAVARDGRKFPAVAEIAWILWREAKQAESAVQRGR